jgi:hypothetical protein
MRINYYFLKNIHSVFLSASYDQHIRIWNATSGACDIGTKNLILFNVDYVYRLFGITIFFFSVDIANAHDGVVKDARWRVKPANETNENGTPHQSISNDELPTMLLLSYIIVLI